MLQRYEAVSCDREVACQAWEAAEALFEQKRATLEAQQALALAEVEKCDLRMQVLTLKLERAEQDWSGEREAEFDEEMRAWAAAPPCAYHDLRGPLPP